MKRKLIEVIEYILMTENKPLTAEAILKEIEKRDLYLFSGSTPKTTIRARLSEDIDREKNKSRFARLQKGTYGLRTWLSEFPGKYMEYDQTIRKNTLLDEILAVFDKSKINEIITSNGLNKVRIDSNWFKLNCYPKIRKDAEENFSSIQLVSAFIVRYGDKIITHTRSARSPEARLHGEKSIILGGHITYEEINSLFDPFDPASSHPFIERELNEEIKILKKYNITPIGLIYDSERDVSSQHLGLVYLVDMTTDEYEIGEKGFHINDMMLSIDEIVYDKEDFENWSLELITELFS